MNGLRKRVVDGMAAAQRAEAEHRARPEPEPASPQEIERLAVDAFRRALYGGDSDRSE